MAGRADALTRFAGRPRRLARCVATGAAIDVLPITLITTGSLRRLAREVGAPVDASRFRAGLVHDNGVEHEEDRWDGRCLRVGTAILKVRTPVPLWHYRVQPDHWCARSLRVEFTQESRIMATADARNCCSRKRL